MTEEHSTRWLQRQHDAQSRESCRNESRRPFLGQFRDQPGHATSRVLPLATELHQSPDARRPNESSFPSSETAAPSTPRLTHASVLLMPHLILFPKQLAQSQVAKCDAQSHQSLSAMSQFRCVACLQLHPSNQLPCRARNDL